MIEDNRRKKDEPPMRPELPKSSSFLSDEEMNALASKILKAEILGNKVNRS